VVRLVRSKGVGVYFVTQNPLDIPDTVLGQLGNRVQHALRAFTPRDQKAVKSAAETMRPNPGLDITATITELGVGEALVSCLDAKGTPKPTERVFILPPASQIGPVTSEQRQALLKNSLVAGVYEQTLDRESAFEKLTGRTSQRAGSGTTEGRTEDPKNQAGSSNGKDTNSDSNSESSGGLLGSLGGLLGGGGGGGGSSRHRASPMEQLLKSAASSIGREVGREIIRGVLGGILGKSRRR
jgi:DNA helicase HerA-like ATPase